MRYNQLVIRIKELFKLFFGLTKEVKCCLENPNPQSEILLVPATTDDLPALKVELIKSFGRFCVGTFGLDGVDLIPPPYLLDESFDRDDQTLYIIRLGSEFIGAALLTEMEDHVTMVDILFLSGEHAKGIGTEVWKAIEKSHSETKLWKLLTPYCERRNINFYINKCGFKITEYFNDYHKGDIMEEYNAVECDYGGFFLFEKEIKTD